MYMPSAFAETNLERITHFVDHHPLATLVAISDGRPQANHLPMMRLTTLTAGERLIAHTAKANPIWRLGENGADVLAIFQGADAYISPSYYPTKAEHHKVVPTYNYAAVHITGRLACSHDRLEKLRVVEMLTQRMEAGRAEPWAVSDAPADYIDKMLEGIVAISITIESVTAKWKASQNRSTVDRRGVAQGLRADARQPADLEAAEIVEQFSQR